MNTLIILSCTTLVLVFYVRGFLSRIFPQQASGKIAGSEGGISATGFREKIRENEKPEKTITSLLSTESREPGPVMNKKHSVPAGNTGRHGLLSSAWNDLIGPLSMKTPEGSASLIGTGGIGACAGIVTLFVDLPVISLALTGMVAVIALTLTAGAAHTRFFPQKNRHDENPAGISPVSGPGNPVTSKRPAITQNTGLVPVPETHGLPGSPGSEHYWVNEPFSSVTIRRNGSQGLDYTVSEPVLTRRDKVILAETHAHLRDVIVYEAGPADTGDHLDPVKIKKIIRKFDPGISDERLSVLGYYLRRDLSGYGPLDVLMKDPALEDISCNGCDLPVFVFHKAHGSIPTSIVFREGELNQYVLRLAQKANKQISLSNPLVDATLPDGARIQITYSDVVSTNGSSFTVRKFRADPMTPLDLLRFGTFSPETMAFLWLAIEHRKSLLIVGGTASGKTSTMNAVSLFIPENAKIVSLEDTREIQLPHRNWLPTRTRELNVPGIRGDIDLFSLLRACMRQRPEYIIVGEVRGPEAQTLFQAQYFTNF